jgi:putative ABC transport system permease protein
VALRLSDAPEAAPVVRRVVGVARQVRALPDEQEAFVQVYVPLAQAPTDDIFLVVRPESGRAETLTSAVRAAIGRIDQEQLVSVRDVVTLDEVAWTATGRHRFRAALVATFAGLAVVLSMVGVFGVLAYSVQQRLREIALRRALGASTGDVVRLVLGRAAGVVGAGLVVGLGLATLSGRFLASMLFGVTPLDPTTFASVVGVLILMTTLAVVAPVWRAVRVDPAVAMREV